MDCALNTEGSVEIKLEGKHSDSLQYDISE